LLTRVVIINDNDALLRFGSISADNASEIKRIKDAVKTLCGLDSVDTMLDYQVDIS
jgi:hypothetical protein